MNTCFILKHNSANYWIILLNGFRLTDYCQVLTQNREKGELVGKLEHSKIVYLAGFIVFKRMQGGKIMHLARIIQYLH